MEVDDDHERFTRLLIPYEPEHLRCVLVAVPNRADARDILQECSVALWRRFSDYDSKRPIVAWALGFVRMEVRRFLRKSQRRAQLTERAAELPLQDELKHATELDERERHLKHCLDGLSEPQRELLDGYYHKQYSVSELSERNGTSVEAVYKMLQRIRLALHQCIESQMGGRSMNNRDWEALIQRHHDGIATREEVADLSVHLESDAATRLYYLQLARIHATLAAEESYEPSAPAPEHRLLDLFTQLDSVDKRLRTRRLVLSVVAAAAMVALIAGVYFLRPSDEPQIATITSIDGSVRWTGNCGQVYDDLESGHPLTGGTLESLAVDSSVEVQFRDGSTVTLTGLSVLTILDRGHKELHLREGNLSATVEVQPEGKPLLVLTPAAELEVLGTQFDVAAGC